MNFSTADSGEALGGASLVMKAIQDKVYSPALSNVFTVCELPCTGEAHQQYMACTDSTIDSCVSQNCNGNDVIIDMWINASVVAPNDYINATIHFNCLNDRSVYSINYNNGSGTWESISCVQCPSDGIGEAEEEGGTHSAVFQVDSNPGTHWMRGVVSYDSGAGATCPETCTTGTYGDNDDMNFTVANLTQDVQNVGLVNISLKDEDDDYLIFNLTGLQNLSNELVLTDVFGKIGKSALDDYYKLGNGTLGKVSDLSGNNWTVG